MEKWNLSKNSDDLLFRYFLGPLELALKYDTLGFDHWNLPFYGTIMGNSRDMISSKYWPYTSIWYVLLMGTLNIMVTLWEWYRHIDIIQFDPFWYIYIYVYIYIHISYGIGNLSDDAWVGRFGGGGHASLGDATCQAASLAHIFSGTPNLGTFDCVKIHFLCTWKQKTDYFMAISIHFSRLCLFQFVSFIIIRPDLVVTIYCENQHIWWLINNVVSLYYYPPSFMKNQHIYIYMYIHMNNQHIIWWLRMVFLPPLGHWSSGRRLLSPCLQLAELESCLGPAVDATCKGFGEVWDSFGLWYVHTIYIYIYIHKYMW